MKRQVLSLATGAVAILAVAGTGYAQEPTAAAQSQAKMKVAAGLIAIGRAEEDPMMLVVGAKLLSGLEGGTSGEEPADASNAFDISTVLDEAKALAGENEYLMEQISDLEGRPERSGERYCNWYENCGYSIVDPYACEQVYVCN